MSIKSLFKMWKPFEIFLLIFGIVSIVVVSIIFNSDLLTVSASLVGVLCALFIAKGKILGKVFGIVLCVLYSVVSFKNGFYGEIIIYMFLMLPVLIWGIISWARNLDKIEKVVLVKKMSGKEWLLLAIGGGAAYRGLFSFKGL